MRPSFRAPAFLLALAATPLLPAAARAQANVTTWHNDNARTGQNLAETLLTPAKVNSTNFGALFSVPVDGKVDAQPLYLSAVSLPGKGNFNLVLAATEHGSVYALNADTGTILWHVSTLGAGEVPSDSRSCGQIVPEIGVTATPVIDRAAGAHGTIYLTAMSKDANGNYYQRLHALDLATGAEQAGSPVAIAATYPGTGANSSGGKVVFDAKQYVDRPGLLLLNDVVYTSWGSHCDIQPYTGWVIGYNGNTLAQTSVFNATPNGSEAAPWNGGSGPAADSSGNLFLALGNGSFDTNFDVAGFPTSRDFGNALLKLTPGAGTLSATDYWTMWDTISQSGRDVDLGSGGVMLLPDETDANGRTRHLVVAAGKDSNLYVADRDNLGKFTPNANTSLYQQISSILPNGMWSSPAFFNNQVFYGSVGNAIQSFAVNQARLSTQPVSRTAASFTYPGTTPAVSANGNINGILWAINNSSPAVLHAYDANNLTTELYNSSQAANGRDHFGNGNKFIVPTIANGKVFVGTPNSVAVFGFLRQTAPPLPDGVYTLTNNSSSLRLDDPSASRQSGLQMIQWPGHGGPNQSWFLSYEGTGYYRIQNVASGLYLADAGNSNAAPLEQVTPTNDDTQLWALLANGSGYVLQNKATGLVFDDPGFNPNQATGIILFSINRGTNQTWAIQQAP